MPVCFLGTFFDVEFHEEDGGIFVDVDGEAYVALAERFRWCVDHHEQLSDAQLEQFVNFVTGRSWLDFGEEVDDVSISALAQLWLGVGENAYEDCFWHEVHVALFWFARVVVLPRNADSARYIVDHIWEHWFEQCEVPVEEVLHYMTSDNPDHWAEFFAASDDDWMPEVRAYFAAAAADAVGPEEDSDALVPSMAVLTI